MIFAWRLYMRNSFVTHRIQFKLTAGLKCSKWIITVQVFSVPETPWYPVTMDWKTKCTLWNGLREIYNISEAIQNVLQSAGCRPEGPAYIITCCHHYRKVAAYLIDPRPFIIIDRVKYTWIITRRAVWKSVLAERHRVVPLDGNRKCSREIRSDWRLLGLSFRTISGAGGVFEYQTGNTDRERCTNIPRKSMLVISFSSFDSVARFQLCCEIYE